MTIAVSLKVHDGVVLAADSASTLTNQQPDGSVGVLNVYNNANKIVNLCKGLPLGVMTWGAGAIGPASMTTIFKDFRAMLCGRASGPRGEDWAIDPADYSVLTVAERLRSYVYDHLYLPAFSEWPQPPALGMIVAGYSAGEPLPEEYQIDMEGGQCPPPRSLRGATECGFTVGGQPEAIARLAMGVDPRMAAVLQTGLGVPAEQVGQAIAVMQQHLQWPLIQNAMPIQDALDLAEFLVEVTIKVTRFIPGPSTVGGPIELAAITKHEGFKWVQRKHYFDAALNQKET